MDFGKETEFPGALPALRARGGAERWRGFWVAVKAGLGRKRRREVPL